LMINSLWFVVKGKKPNGGEFSKVSTVRGKLRQRTVSLYRSMSYGLFCPGTI
jgi:hypothetical protein